MEKLFGGGLWEATGWPEGVPTDWKVLGVSLQDASLPPHRLQNATSEIPADAKMSYYPRQNGLLQMPALGPALAQENSFFKIGHSNGT
jgi:hypothetical protein